MRVLVDGAVFSSPEVSELDLYQLFKTAFDGPHLLLIDQDPCPNLEVWLDKQAEKTREECRLVLEESLREEASGPQIQTILVKPSGQPDWLKRKARGQKRDSQVRDVPRLPLPLAVEILTSPLEVWVEDQRNDMNFLQAVARGGRKARLERALQNEWLRPRHGGGLSRLTTQIESLPPGYRERLKTWILFDSDGLRPGLESRDSQRLRKLCQGRKLSYHQLRRRSIENYIPPGALRGWWSGYSRRTDREKRRRLVEAFLSLEVPQRHHYNFKKGFAGDERRKDRREVGDLYHELPVSVKAILQSGFPADLVKLFDAQISRPFKEKWLIRDGQGAEIDPMLDQLLRLV